MISVGEFTHYYYYKTIGDQFHSGSVHLSGFPGIFTH